MGTSFNCCESNKTSTVINTEEIESHKPDKDKTKNPALDSLIGRESQAKIAKIQTIYKGLKFYKKFFKNYIKRKAELIRYFKDNNYICEIDDINFYTCPKVKQVEDQIRNREGIYSNACIPDNLFKKITVHSKYNIELPCIYLNEDQIPRPVYKGFWNVDKKKNGYGILVKSDGSKSEGMFSNGRLSGYGRYIAANGDVFEGEYLNGVINGHGVYIHYDGNVYIGDWLEDKTHGNGKEYFIDGSSYEGSFVNGMKTGKGKFMWVDGSHFEGELKNDLFAGYGVYHFADGKIYKGNWKDNKMNGVGVLTQQDGSKYEGEFLDNKKHGKGTHYWNENKYYDGNWKEGKQHGEGFMFKNGKIEKGTWVEGKKNKE